MSTQTDVTSPLLSGVAGMLADADVATWRQDGSVYADSETALTFKDMPDKPDRLVVLSPFGASHDEPELPFGRQMVQVRFRGTDDPADVDALADQAFAVLHGATDLTFGPCHVVQILRVNSIPMGMDDQAQRRWHRADNYALDVDYPTTPNRPI